MTRPIDADSFAKELGDILSNVDARVNERLPEAVRTGLRKGAVEWRRQIREKIPPNRTYRKHGKTYTVGKYGKSIRTHMTQRTGPRPSGEVGAPRMPGLPHLLEFGHARVGGGRVRAIEHVAPAADVAFEVTERAALEAIGEALDDA